MELENKINYLYKFESILFDKADRIAKKIIINNPNFQKDIRYTTYNVLQ